MNQPLREEYLGRVRERLAEGPLLDAAFDCLLPRAVRSRSTLHWTPVAVARLVARRLAEHGASRVLDAGSGPGKFCLLAASACPTLTFIGIERRAELVFAAQELAAELQVVNAHFEVGDALLRSWAEFDGFYFFNPFAEDALRLRDAGGGKAQPRFAPQALQLALRLREARLGSVLITYHGLGGPIPSSYQLKGEESTGTGRLRTWIKTTDKEQAWCHLDEGGVSRVAWSWLEQGRP